MDTPEGISEFPPSIIPSWTASKHLPQCSFFSISGEGLASASGLLSAALS